MSVLPKTKKFLSVDESVAIINLLESRYALERLLSSLGPVAHTFRYIISVESTARSGVWEGHYRDGLLKRLTRDKC